MRVLILGQSGQLGSALAERFGSAPSLGALKHITALFANRSSIDFEQPETIEPALQAFSPDVVINAAAYTAVDQAEDEPERAMAINADGPRRLAQLMSDRGGRLIHVSTDYVFDGQKQTPYLPGDPTAPQSVYGRSKAAGEAAIRDEIADHVIVRTAWVYSPFGANFVKTMLRLARDRDELTVVEDQWGQPTSAHDLADGIMTILAGWQGGARTGLGETYHLTGTGDTNWAEFARAVFTESALLGGPTANVTGIPSSAWPAKAARPVNSRLDGSKFSDVFGFCAPEWHVSLRDVVRRLLTETI